MIEIRETITLSIGKGLVANKSAYWLTTSSKVYDFLGIRWEVFEDVNGDKFWAREVKK